MLLVPRTSDAEGHNFTKSSLRVCSQEVELRLLPGKSHKTTELCYSRFFPRCQTRTGTVRAGVEWLVPLATPQPSFNLNRLGVVDMADIKVTKGRQGVYLLEPVSENGKRLLYVVLQVNHPIIPIDEEYLEEVIVALRAEGLDVDDA